MFQSGCFPKDLAEEVMDLYENAKLKVNLRKFLGNLLGDNMKEWMSSDCELEGNTENIPSPKRKKSDHPGTSQFGTKLGSPRSIAKASKGFVPPNTAASTCWACGNFDACQVRMNVMNLGDPVPDNLLESGNADELNKWLSLRK